MVSLTNPLRNFKRTDLVSQVPSHDVASNVCQALALDLIRQTQSRGRVQGRSAGNLLRISLPPIVTPGRSTSGSCA
jgi:hypothetical protein